MGQSTCCVLKCPKTHRILHKFPRPDERRPWKLMVFKIWLYRACNRIAENEAEIDDVVKHYKICDLHFSECCKLPPYNKLRRGSLPTLFLPSFQGESNETNSQFALLQYCLDSEEMKMFADNYKPPQKLTKDDYEIDSINEPQRIQPEPPLVFTIPDISREEVELKNVVPQQKIITEEKPPEVEKSQDVEKPPEPQPPKPHFKSVKIYLTHDNCLSEVCRICFCAIQSDQIVKLYDEFDDGTDDTKKLRDMLKLVLPELDLEVYQNSVICKKCKELLVSSFELRTAWLSTEDKLRRIIENEKSIATKHNASLVLIAGTSKPKKIPEKIGPPDHNYARKPELDDAEGSNSPFHFNVKIRKRELVDKGPFLCEQCGLILSKRGSLKTHLLRHEKRIEKQDEEQRESMCEACGLIFDTLLEMKKHFARKHKKQTKTQMVPSRFQCDVCDKVLFSKYSLQKHVRHVHLRIYNYAQCHRCGKKLTSKGALRAHLLQHDAERRYHCEECGKSFFWMRSLRKHLLRHSSVKLACEYCGKKVKYEWTLKRHIQIFHMNEGNTNCEFCGKPYWKKYDLIRHKIRVHNWKSGVEETE